MRPISRAARVDAPRVLRSGGTVVFPTETAYGIAADATNAQAVRRVMQVKGRDAGKTAPLIVASRAMAARYAVLSPALRALAKQHWPGPLTIVAPARPDSGLASDIIRADGTIAVRVSSHPTARALSRALGGPILATSANRAGQPTCYSVQAIKRQFAGRKVLPDLFLDAGTLPKRLPSTIITEREGNIEVLRAGSIRFTP